MYVVTVYFKITVSCVRKFEPLMIQQAKNSLELEEGCIQFDVCRSRECPTDFFLYEVYKSKEDFDAHLASKHFQTFNEQVSPWVEHKNIQFWLR